MAALASSEARLQRSVRQARRALAVALVLALTAALEVNAWQAGRATHYTGYGSGGNEGACSFGTIGNRFPLRRQFAAWPGDKGTMCGKCVEVKCDPRVVTDATGRSYDYTPTVCKGGSVIVLITDDCPCGPNSNWCCGDQPHLDLSAEAFNAISQDRGVMATQWRIVDCPGTGFQKPAGCNTVLKAYQGCGDSNGPYKDRCCGQYMACKQKSAFFWQCLADEGGAAVADDRGQGSSGSSEIGANRRKRSSTRSSSRRAKTKKAAKKPKAHKPKPHKKHRNSGCKKIANWQPCGGLKGPARNGKHGKDGPWKGYCCNKGFHCKRFSKFYWQCRKN